MILALDTATRAGSVALMRDGQLRAWRAGDPEVTHGERLPGDLLALLRQEGQQLGDVDLFAVCTGPGSFTGLRVGLATMQALALAHRTRVIGVPTLEALASAGLWSLPEDVTHPKTVVPWMDAHRGEVFAAVYASRPAEMLGERQPPSVGSAESLLQRFRPVLSRSPLLFVGDAVHRSRAAITAAVGRAPTLVNQMPPLAPTVARLAHGRPERAVGPHAVRPVYVRRPDAELARERRRPRLKQL